MNSFVFANKYTAIGTIGRGTYGTVYLCASNKSQQLYVLKEVPMNTLDNEKYKETVNEIKVLSTLYHPFIIKYIESFYMNMSMCIIMEYATQGNLAQYMFKKSHYLLPQTEILFIFNQILLGVQHLHSKKIIHRDLKAENILITGHHGNVIKIGDFGIAKVLQNEKAISIIGTPYYLAPELCENKPYDTKTDVWALGCLLYEMCTHRRAFDANTLIGLIKVITSGNVLPINTCFYERELQTIIDNMLVIIPEKRYSIEDILKQNVLQPTLQHIKNSQFFTNYAQFCDNKILND